MTEAAGVSLDLSLHTCQIVSAYVSNNHVARSELPALIATIRSALSGLTTGGKIVAEDPLEKSTPALIRKSITPNALISFVDGKPYKTLRRHLTAKGFDPNSYRVRFGLPHDYPMVAPSYSERRSVLARSYGLGKQNDRDGHAKPTEALKNGRGKRS